MSARRIDLRSGEARAICAAALCCLLGLLVFAVPGAWATRTHPAVGEKFGPDGTEATSFENVAGLAINQSNRHLFAYKYSGQIHGFAINSAASRTPLGAPFPVEAPGYSSYPTVLASGQGNIYYFTSGSHIYGIKENGEKIAARFPVYPPRPATEPGYLCGGAVDGSGDVWVEIMEAPWTEPTLIVEYSPNGEELRSMRLSEEIGGEHLCTMGFNTATNDMYVSQGQYGGEYGVYKVTGASEYEHAVKIYPQPASHIAVDAATGVVYMSVGGFEARVVAVAPSGSVLEEFAAGEEISGLAIDETDETVYVSRRERIEVFPAGAVLPEATTEGVASATPTSTTVTATVDPAGGPPITNCTFEYGETTNYESGSVPCDQAPPLSSAQTVTATLPNLKPGRKYHYRVVVANANGTARGADRVATVAARPTIDGLFSSNLNAGSAEITARINPQGSATTYFFEYGTTAQYGSVIPVPPGQLGSGQDDQQVTQQLTGLSPITYHFRVIAENQLGRVASPDQTFSYYPPECPNAHLRQQTGGSYLPDCRAYELVSPGNAGGAIMFPEAAQPAPYATNPARFAFGAALGVIPGTQPTNAVGVDTFVATRTDSGWVTHLGGLRGYETLGASHFWGDKGLNKGIDFREQEDFGGVPQPPEYMPFVWGFENNFLERWPAGYENIPGSEESRGAFQPDAEFTHLAFSSNNVAFAKGGLEEAPGSAYDYDVATHTTTLISLMPNGEPIAQSPSSSEAKEFIFFPGNQIQTLGFSPPLPIRGDPSRHTTSGVSGDGSHILMATTKFGFSGGEEPTNNLMLYMRVDDAITYLVSKEHYVNYVGMTANGGKVYFTSREQLTGEDLDHSLDLYVWSEATDSLTLISQGSGGSGQGESCESEWSFDCRIEVVKGKKASDNSVASSSGDVYFYSPEQLDGEDQGVPGKRNLYVYRNGGVHFVATFGEELSEAVSRIQVSPDGGHMALVTKAQLNSYDNAGFAEMYSYDAGSGNLVCVSCLPSGESPSSPVEASRDGLFMSNDGRTFFYTGDALVPRDTDKIHDVYEYTEGQAQLISSGTGSQDRQLKAASRPGGFAGVSANGVDAYFVTYENLVPQDENGQFLKYYDARVDGGFPYVKPPAACEAADECHGEGSTPPTLAQIVSEDAMGGGGNTSAPATKKSAKKHKKAHKKKSGKHRKRAARRHQRSGGTGR